MPIKRFPAHDPRSWDLPTAARSRVISAEEAPVAGQWVEDPRTRSGWRWDGAAPAGDPSPTRIRNHPVPPFHELGTPRRDTMTEQPQPRPSDELVAFDPNDPHDPQATQQQQPATQDDAPEPQDGDAPVCCPTCGTGVHPDRLR